MLYEAPVPSTYSCELKADVFRNFLRMMQCQMDWKIPGQRQNWTDFFLPIMTRAEMGQCYCEK